MLVRLLEILRYTWWGAWRPMFLLPPQPRWYHHIDYWLHRIRDIIAGILLFLIPPWTAYFVYLKYASAPAATLVFTALVAAFWVLSVVVSYFAGKMPYRQR